MKVLLNKICTVGLYSLVFIGLIGVGVYFAILKNQQTYIQREIDKTKARTESQKNILNQHQAELQNSYNRFILKEQIRKGHTTLIPVKHDDIHEIESAPMEENR